MDQNNQNDIEKYIGSLPEEVKNFLTDGVWEQRTSEVAKKYSLSEIQIEDLTNAVLLVLVGIIKPQLFLENIIKDLNISQLLADQIVNDLENRVFEYAIKEIESKQNGKQLVTSSEKNAPISKPKVPEVKPQNLPMVEPGEPVHINKPPISPILEPTTPKINFKPEPVQRPVSVPRFTPSLRDVISSSNTEVAPDNIIENKLKNITNGVEENKPKRVVDPYREPVE